MANQDNKQDFFFIFLPTSRTPSVTAEYGY